MKLQVALDSDWTLDRTLDLIATVQDSIDIVEIGTPLLLTAGLGIVAGVKGRYPHLPVLADLKIMDAGEYEAGLAFKAGADLVTVLAVADDQTIRGALAATRAHGGKLVVDMIAVPDLPMRLREIDALGAGYICLHTSKDLQKLRGDTDAVFAQLKQHVTRTGIALAGGIHAGNVAQYARIRPDIIIVGEGITAAADPSAAARAIRRALDAAAANAAGAGSGWDVQG